MDRAHVRKTPFCKKEYFIEVSTGLVIHTVSGGNKNFEYPKELRQERNEHLNIIVSLSLLGSNPTERKPHRMESWIFKYKLYYNRLDWKA